MEGWRIREIARQERGRGKRIWVSYGKIQIEGKWWRWDENEQTLKDEEGRAWRSQEEGEAIEEEKAG